MGLKSAIDDLANAVARVPEALPKADTLPITLGTDPAEKVSITTQELRDFTLPKSLKDWLVPSLELLKFSIETVKVERRFSPERSYDVIKNAAGSRVMLHLSKNIITEALNWEAVGGALQALGFRDVLLLVVSEKVERMALGYTVLAVPTWAEDFKITWTFVPWGDLEEVRVMGESDLLASLPNILRLEPLLAEAQKLPVTEVSPGDIGTLTKILSSLTVFTDEGGTGRRVLLTQAGLGEVVPSFDYAGPANTVAFSLISELKNRRRLDAYPDDEVLGVLLCYLLTLGELKPADAISIQTILRTYKLAPSRGY